MIPEGWSFDPHDPPGSSPVNVDEYKKLTSSIDQIMFFCTFALKIDDENSPKLQSLEQIRLMV